MTGTGPQAQSKNQEEDTISESIHVTSEYEDDNNDAASPGVVEYRRAFLLVGCQTELLAYLSKDRA